MSLYVWYRPLDGFGEECVDLSRCRRFVCSTIGVESDRSLTIYETKDPKWIAFREYTQDYWSPDGEWEPSYEESYEQVRGEEAAFEILHVPRYMGKLTEALEQYREYGDLEAYRKWRREQQGECLRPNWDSSKWVISYGAAWSQPVGRQAVNQRRIFDALQMADWPRSGVNVRMKNEKLNDTMKDITWKRSAPFRLWHTGGRVGWDPRDG